MTKIFSEDEVVKLCLAIQARPSLYNPASEQFGKSLANKAVWDEIAAMFADKGFTADDIKLKWKNLRDTKALLHRKSNRDPNTWRFYEYLRFLNDYERPPRKNGRKFPSTASSKDTSINTNSSSGDTETSDEPPEKQMKPTLMVNAKTDDAVEPSDSSRDSNFEDTHDSLLKHFAGHAHGGSNAITTLVQTPISQVQSPSLYAPHMQHRDLYDLFGEEVAMRLRSIDSSGNRALFFQVRRKINEALDDAELELFAKNTAAASAHPSTSAVNSNE